MKIMELKLIDEYYDADTDNYIVLDNKHNRALLTKMEKVIKKYYDDEDFQDEIIESDENIFHYVLDNYIDAMEKPMCSSYEYDLM